MSEVGSPPSPSPWPCRGVLGVAAVLPVPRRLDAELPAGALDCLTPLVCPLLAWAALLRGDESGVASCAEEEEEEDEEEAPCPR